MIVIVAFTLWPYVCNENQLQTTTTVHRCRVYASPFGRCNTAFFVGRSSNHVKQSWGDAVQLFVLYDPVVIHRSVFFRWPCVLYVGMLQYIYVAILMLEKLTISIVMDGWLVFVLWNIQTAVWSSDNGNDPRCWTKVMSYRRNKFEQSQRAKLIIQAIDRIFILKQ